MSTQPTEAPAAEQKKGLSKYVSRMKTILRRDPSKRRSTSSMLSPTAAAQSAAPPTDTAQTTTPAVAVDTTTTTGATATEATPPKPVITMRSQVELERIRHLADKYDLDLSTDEWKVLEPGERVEKPVRMRIHRTCHSCNATFGANKICSSCGHRRCEQCPRYPKKRDPADKDKAVGLPGGHRGVTGAGEGGDASDGLKRKHKYVLTLPSRTGGQDLVMRRPKQRVRRICHHCETVYLPGNKICSKCAHARCVDCPRYPAKRHKYPDGYPGDAPGSEEDVNPADPQSAARAIRPKRKPRYSCHNCSTIFKSDTPACAKCGHEKCTECKRVPPKKVDPEHDPEVVRRVQEKLQALGVGSAGADPPP